MTLSHDCEKIQKLLSLKVKTTDGELKKVLNRKGEPMTEEALKEWQKAFTDIEESIENIELEEGMKNPYSRYLRMKQQDLF